jgi:DSBA-like thioredoxin domain
MSRMPDDRNGHLDGPRDELEPGQVIEAEIGRIVRHPQAETARLRQVAADGEHGSAPFLEASRCSSISKPEPVPGLAPLDEELDHARGPTPGRLILEYGDYECPCSRRTFRAIEYVEQELSGRVRVAFRHFPVVQIHPHAFGAAAATEEAALQDCFWAMHELLFQWQEALEDDDLRRYAEQLGLDVARFDRDRVGRDVRRRIRRDVETGLASAEVRGTPTLFIDGVAYVGCYDAASLIEALSR